MRRIVLPLLVLLLFATTASAETYIINGRATYSDNSQVQFYDISIDCEVSENNCRQYRGTSTQTDRYGNFTMFFNANEDDDGTSILLILKGEEFEHTIDLALLQSSGGSITQDIKLTQSATQSAGFSSGCCLIFFVIMALYIIGKTARMLSTPQGRLEFRGYKPAKTLECPTCNVVISQHQLLKHLVVDHDMELVEAGEVTGKAMRKTWSEEE